ncbi:MAG TPA: anti-sigma factor [Terriglobales bacterium]|nr:anti-sigma factor [Terriglobales bacterium]
MASDIWQPKIDRYVDAELSDEEMRAMDAHLRECSSCAVQALRQMRLKHDTKLAARRYAPSPQFRRKIANQVIADQVGARRPVSWRWGWAPLLAAAVMILLVAGIFLSRSSEQARSEQLLSELTDIHVANLAASSPVDVVSSDRHTVKPWFQGKVPFSFNLPELAGSPFTLVGGRLTYLDHEPGAHLIYNIGAHHISVFVYRDQPDLAHAFSTGESSRDVLKFHVESWSAHELRYFVVGDASDEFIHKLTSMWKEAGNN